MMRPEMEMTPAFREQMYYGSLWAGLVLNAHGTSFPHPYGYVLTENHRIPHGKACAVFLPALLLHCAQYAPEKNGTLSAGVRYGSSGGESAF